MARAKSVSQNAVAEWSFRSKKACRNPFRDVELAAVFTDPDGGEKEVPAFWAGGLTWKVRYASALTGTHRFRTVCSDRRDAGLHDRTGALRVGAYRGRNPLRAHGGVTLSPDRTCFTHQDGTPFFFLGDTWWWAFSKRIGWPRDFKTLVADRKRKGFNVILIHTMASGGDSKADRPWAQPYTRINPAFFDKADRRIAHLVGQGLAPFLVGCWGPRLQAIGERNLFAYWRYIIARYGAYPVIWCAAGEATIPPYGTPMFHLFMDHLGPRRLSAAEKRKLDRWLTGNTRSWGNVIRYIRKTDPFGRLTTNHTPCLYDSRDMVDDPALIDMNLPQCSHDDLLAVPNAVQMIVRGRRRVPRCPSLVGEAAYEGIKGGSGANVQRLLFWSSVLSGAPGYVYGADGLWQAGVPGGTSGGEWGSATFEKAYRLPGSTQIGIAKRLLERYPWWEFDPHPDWVTPAPTKGDYIKPYAAGIPGEVRVVFFPAIGNHYRKRNGELQFIYTPAYRRLLRLKKLERGVRYRARYVSPVTGVEHDLGRVTGVRRGEWVPPAAPDWGDWVLVVERV